MSTEHSDRFIAAIKKAMRKYRASLNALWWHYQSFTDKGFKEDAYAVWDELKADIAAAGRELDLHPAS